MPKAMQLRLSADEIREIHGAAPFNPMYPMSFLYNYKGGQPYNLGHTPSHNQQYQMAAWIDAPPKPVVSSNDLILLIELLLMG